MRLEDGTGKVVVMGDDTLRRTMCSRPTTPTTNATQVQQGCRIDAKAVTESAMKICKIAESYVH